MLNLAIPDNLETDADFERAYWRVALPAGGLCAGVVGLVELWHAFGVLGVVGAFGCSCIAGMSTLMKVDHKSAADFDYAGALRLARAREGEAGGRASSARSCIAKAQEAQPPTFFNPQAIACPYPEHGPHCLVIYQPATNDVWHKYNGIIERMSVTPLNEVKVKDPRHTVRIAS